MRDFDQIVTDNTGWLYKFIRSLVQSDHTAEELTQHTFYLAYKSWSGYCEYGKERAWLKAIARNAVRKHYNDANRMICVSLDADDPGGYYNILASGEPAPDDKLAREELIGDILRLIAALPRQQRIVVTHRYVNNFSVAETSRVTGLPEATVKTNAYYGIRKIREQLGITENTIKKGETKMKKCIDHYGVLFEYAKGYLTRDERASVAEHIGGCADCAKIVNALTAIWSYLQKEFTEDDSYFNVIFQADENVCVTYVGCSCAFSKQRADELNEMLGNNGNKIPDGQTIFGWGHDAGSNLLSVYANEGGEIEFEVIPQSESHLRTVFKTMPKIYEHHWIYNVFVSKQQYIAKSKDAPNLYTGFRRNGLGRAAKCGLFSYAYDGATNIRIKKGSGVLDLGGAKFAYSQRFTSEEEMIDLSFTFNM